MAQSEGYDRRGRKNHDAVILLTIDDDVARTYLSKIYQLKFASVHAVKTPTEAEDILAELGVTHLICENKLRNNPTLGAQLILRWKKKYDSIERAVLYNRSLPNSKYLPQEIDQVLEKNPELAELWRAVGIGQ